MLEIICYIVAATILVVRAAQLNNDFASGCLLGCSIIIILRCILFGDKREL